MINISKFLMLLALCNPIISANKEENSEMLVCPQSLNIKYMFEEHECNKVLKFLINKPISSWDTKEIIKSQEWIKKNQRTFMDYLTKYNANEKTIAYFKNEDEIEDETKDETIENNDNKNQ